MNLKKNNFINSNNQRVQNIENKELSLFSNINYLNNLTFKDEKIEADINEKNENENKKGKSPRKKNKDKSRDEKVKKK